MNYYYEMAQQAIEDSLELHSKASKLPNPGSFRRGIMACLFDKDGVSDLQKQEEVDAQRESLEEEARDRLRVAAEYADSLMDELEARGMKRSKLRDRFIRLATTSPRSALAVLKEAVDLVERAELARAENEALRTRALESVHEVANEYGMEGEASIRNWND